MCLNRVYEEIVTHYKLSRKFSGAPDRTRTCGLWVRNPTLYPAELRELKET